MQVMHETGADFTNTFCWLAKVPLPEASSGKSNPIAVDNGQSSANAPEQNGAEPSSSGMLQRALCDGRPNQGPCHCCKHAFRHASNRQQTLGVLHFPEDTLAGVIPIMLKTISCCRQVC